MEASKRNFLKIAFDSEFDFYNEVRNLKMYHEECVKVLSDIEQLDHNEVKDKFASGEIIIPKRPRYGLAKLLELSPKNEINLEKLHAKLINLLVYDFQVSDNPLPNTKDMNSIYSFLTQCYDNLKKCQAKNFHMYAVFGRYLDIYKQNFFATNNEDSWGTFLKKHFKISESYAKNTISVGRFVNKYPKFQYLSISIRQFMKLKKSVIQLVENDKYKSFWKDTK